MVERTMAASLGSLGHVEHERLVQLDLVHRQPFEVGERGVAGAEVVPCSRAVRRALHRLLAQALRL
jgi:hypothetical protein